MYIQTTSINFDPILPNIISSATDPASHIKYFKVFKVKPYWKQIRKMISRILFMYFIFKSSKNFKDNLPLQVEMQVHNTEEYQMLAE